MNIFDQLYNTVINEALANKFNTKLADFTKLLKQETNNYNAKYGAVAALKNIDFRPARYENGQAEILWPILKLIKNIDIAYTKAILEFNQNARDEQLKKEKASLFKIDTWWQEVNSKYAAINTVQPQKIVFMNTLYRLGILGSKVRDNIEGFPVYQFHNVHKLIQLNIIDQLLSKGEISPEKASVLRAYISPTGDVHKDTSARDEIKKGAVEYIGGHRPDVKRQEVIGADKFGQEHTRDLSVTGARKIEAKPEDESDSNRNRIDQLRSRNIKLHGIGTRRKP